MCVNKSGVREDLRAPARCEGCTSVFLIVLISKQGGLPAKSQRPDVIISLHYVCTMTMFEI